MPFVVGSAAAFVDCVRKSGLLDETRLDTFLDALPAPPEDARKLAERMVSVGLLTAYQAGFLIKGKHKGFIIAEKYRLLDLLGTGGMGRVFLCEHVRMRRLVAIKMLPQSQAESPGNLERFDREARAVAALKHPNLVQAYDIDDDGKNHFLVMEYVDGVSLENLVDRFGPLDPIRAAHYLSQAALGLHHAHETAGLIHRDIKPNNLLLDRTGTLKILDMGLAKFFHDAEDDLTHRYDEKKVLGTADYLSPEQAMNSREVDIRGDVYSLGATFYFALTGQKPLGEGNVAQKLVWIESREPTPIEKLQPAVPLGIVSVIKRMMAKDPDERYQNPIDVAQALEQWTDLPITPPSEVEIPQRLRNDDHRSSVRIGDPRSGRIQPTSGASRAPSSSRMDLPTPSPTSSRTARQPIPADVPPARSVPGRRPSWVKYAPLCIGVAVLTLVLLSLLADQKPVGDDGPSRTDNKPRTWSVSKTGPLTTIQSALEKAIPGDSILVTQSPWVESLTLSSENYRGNIAILGDAGNGRPVVWKPSTTESDNTSILTVSDVNGLRLENFTFDGNENCNDLVKISGNCDGLRCRRLSFEHFNQNALSLRNLHSDVPTKFDLLHVRGSSESNCAISFHSDERRECRDIQITQSRFDGPGRAVLRIGGTVRQVQFRKNRVADWTAGLWYEDTDIPATMDVTIESNTFYHVQKVIELDVQPPRSEPLRVHRNLMIECPAWVVMKKGVLTEKPLWLDTRGANASGMSAPSGLIAFGLLGGFECDTNDVIVDSQVAEFLTYPRGSKLMTAIDGRAPVGATSDE